MDKVSAKGKEMILRGERPADFDAIYEINQKAFPTDAEAKLINELRKCKNYVKGLSIVAVEEDKILGHAMFTRAFIVNRGRRFNCLALGPMAVLPEYQRKGIGGKLMEEGLERAKENGYKAIFVLGHAEYYPKFGFIPASTKKIRTRFTAPDENFMILELVPNALKGIVGLAEYAREFNALMKNEPPKAKENTVEIEDKAQDTQTANQPADKTEEVSTSLNETTEEKTLPPEDNTKTD
jgi:putative acetyltransferase